MAPIRLPMFSFGPVECTGEWVCRCEGDEVPLFTGKCGSSPTGKTTSRVCGCSAGSSSCPAAPRSGRSNGRSACRWFRSSARRSFTVRPGRPDSSRHSRAGRGGRRRRASWTTPAPCPPSASRSPGSVGCSKSCQIRYEGHRRGPPATAPKKCRPSPPLVRSTGPSSPSPSPGGKSPPASLPAGRTDLGRPWTRGPVHRRLADDPYAAPNVCHRTSFNLETPARPGPARAGDSGAGRLPRHRVVRGFSPGAGNHSRPREALHRRRKARPSPANPSATRSPLRRPDRRKRKPSLRRRVAPPIWPPRLRPPAHRLHTAHRCQLYRNRPASPAKVSRDRAGSRLAPPPARRPRRTRPRQGTARARPWTCRPARARPRPAPAGSSGSRNRTAPTSRSPHGGRRPTKRSKPTVFPRARSPRASSPPRGMQQRPLRHLPVRRPRRLRRVRRARPPREGAKPRPRLKASAPRCGAIQPSRRSRSFNGQHAGPHPQKGGRGCAPAHDLVQVIADRPADAKVMMPCQLRVEPLEFGWGPVLPGQLAAVRGPGPHTHGNLARRVHSIRTELRPGLILTKCNQLITNALRGIQKDRMRIIAQLREKLLTNAPKKVLISLPTAGQDL